VVPISICISTRNNCNDHANQSRFCHQYFQPRPMYFAETCVSFRIKRLQEAPTARYILTLNGVSDEIA
jgi:hypothetical protein